MTERLPLFCTVLAFFVAGCDSGPAGVDPDGAPAPQLDATVVDDAMSTPEVDAAPEPFVPDLERGALLYGVYCAFCHGADGEGYVSDNANALASPEFLAAATDEFISQAIRHGRPSTPMSGWARDAGGPLYDDGVGNVTAYVRAWETLEPVELGGPHEGIAARGRPTYNVLCKSCHGENGEGVTAISLNNPWFSATASDGFIRYAIESGRTGTAMVAFEDTLTSQQVEDLVALIRSWQRPVGEDPFAGFEADLGRAIINPAGENPQFELREDKFVAVDVVKAALDAGQRMVLLDARPAGDYARSHIEGAVSLPFYEVENFIDELPRDAWIIPYCGCPHAVSGQAYDILDANGFEHLAILDEGFFVWTSLGYPISAGN